MRRAAWCAGVGGDEAFCRVSGHVLRRRATSERGGLGVVGVGVIGVGERPGFIRDWDWGDWGWGSRALGESAKRRGAWCAGVGGGRSNWCLVPCVTQCLVRRGVTSNSHGRGVRTSPHTSDVRP